MHSISNKLRFKVIHHLQYCENMHFLPPPLILRPFRPALLVLKSKSAKMFENLVFLIMSTSENIHLIARTSLKG